MCIVCSRCVRACEEVQGIFALTIDGRGFASTVSAGAKEAFMDSEYVSVLKWLCADLPDGHADGKERDRRRAAGTQRGHHLRLL